MNEWDECAADWDDSAAVQAYADGAFESLTTLANAVGVDLRSATVCDFGCGTGLLTERLAPRCAGIDAIDPSTAMRAELGTKIDRHGWNHVRALDELPTACQSYGVIVCSSVLAFVDDYRATVETLVSHLAPEGLFVQWDWERNPEDEEPYGFTSTEIRERLEAVGLASVAVGVGFEADVAGETMRPLIGSGRRRS